MAVKTNLYLDTRRALKDDKYPVKVRVTFLRKQKYFPTNINLTEKDFNAVISKNPKGKFFDTRVILDEKLSKFREAIDSMHHFSFSRLEKIINSCTKDVHDIFPFFDEMINQCNQRGSIRTGEMYALAKKSFKEYQSVIGFYEISPEWLKEYEGWMLSKGKSLTTIGIYLRHLRAVYNKAMADNVITDHSYYPFKKHLYRIPVARNIKKALTREEIKSIAEFTDFHTINENKYRDIWLFLYLSNGMNPNDLCRLQWKDIDGDIIRFYRRKTIRTTLNTLPISFYLRPESKKIIERWGDKNSKYIFGVIKDGMNEVQIGDTVHQFRQNINWYNKRIAKRIGLNKPVTAMHARYSFSQTMKNSGQSIEFISEALGHSNILTTRTYLSSFKDDLIKAAAENLL